MQLLLRPLPEAFGPPLAPRPLCEALLSLRPRGGELALRAAAAAGDAFRVSNGSLLQAAWRAAAEGTDWRALGALRGEASDRRYARALAATQLAAAAAAVYGPGAFCAGAQTARLHSPRLPSRTVVCAHPSRSL